MKKIIEPIVIILIALTLLILSITVWQKNSNYIDKKNQDLIDQISKQNQTLANDTLVIQNLENKLSYTIIKKDEFIVELRDEVEEMNNSVLNLEKELQQQIYGTKNKDLHNMFIDEEWQEVIIETYDETIILDNPSIIFSFFNQYLFKYDLPYYEEFRPSSVPNYIYTFKSKNNTFVIEVENENTISLLDELGSKRYFRTQNGADLGNAFTGVYQAKIIDDIIAKIAGSSYIAKDGSLWMQNFKSYRMTLLAISISQLQVLDTKPTDLLNNPPTESYRAYYHGDEIILTPHGLYLQIIDGNNEFWYKNNQETIDSGYDCNGIIHLIMFGAG